MGVGNKQNGGHRGVTTLPGLLGGSYTGLVTGRNGASGTYIPLEGRICSFLDGREEHDGKEEEYAFEKDSSEGHGRTLMRVLVAVPLGMGCRGLSRLCHRIRMLTQGLVGGRAFVPVQCHLRNDGLRSCSSKGRHTRALVGCMNTIQTRGPP